MDTPAAATSTVTVAGKSPELSSSAPKGTLGASEYVKRAAGGPVTSGAPALVGERGPELFVPPQPGSVESIQGAAPQQPASQFKALVAAIDAMDAGGLPALKRMDTPAAATSILLAAGNSPELSGSAPRNVLGANAYDKRAAGGPVTGNSPYLVGERGPELFVPPQSGSIKSNMDTMGMTQQEPPQVTVVNVDSAENTLNALGSEEGENLIMNVIQRNPEILRSL